MDGTPQTKISSVEGSTIDTTVDTTSVEDTMPLVSAPADTFPQADPTAVNFLVVGTDDVSCSALCAHRHVSFASSQATASHLSSQESWVAPGGGRARINSAYRANDPQLLIDTIKAEFRVSIDHFIQLNYCGFRKLVDSIGGVTIPVPYPVRDTSPTFVLLQGARARGNPLSLVRSSFFGFRTSQGCGTKILRRISVELRDSKTSWSASCRARRAPAFCSRR